jgi:hypothetical protein
VKMENANISADQLAKRAKRIKTRLTELGVEMKLGQAYEAQAIALGYPDWATLSALKDKGQPTPLAIGASIHEPLIQRLNDRLRKAFAACDFSSMDEDLSVQRTQIAREGADELVASIGFGPEATPKAFSVPATNTSDIMAELCRGLREKAFDALQKELDIHFGSLIIEEIASELGECLNCVVRVLCVWDDATKYQAMIAAIKALDEKLINSYKSHDLGSLLMAVDEASFKTTELVSLLWRGIRRVRAIEPSLDASQIRRLHLLQLLQQVHKEKAVGLVSKALGSRQFAWPPTLTP